MKLVHLANQKVIICRLMPVAGSANKIALATVTAALGHLQPLQPEKTQAIAGVPGKTFVIYLDNGTDIKENDQLKDEDNNIYTVRKGGVTKWVYGAMDYLEVYLIRT